MNLNCSKEKIDKITARYAEWIEEVVLENTDSPIFFLKIDHAIDFFKSIRTEEGLEFNFLSDLTAYDDNPPIAQIPSYGLGTLKNSGGDHRFVVVYQLFSLQTFDRVRIKIRAKEGLAVPSVTSVWKSANWLEREVWDMYGIRFEGHPDLRRILLDERWVGHPQRKDYPIKKYQRFEGASALDSFHLRQEK